RAVARCVRSRIGFVRGRKPLSSAGKRQRTAGRRSVGLAIWADADSSTYIYTSVATPRPRTSLRTLALKHWLWRVPPEEPFSYIAEGMRLPGVSRRQVRATKLHANYEKYRLAAKSTGWRHETAICTFRSSFVRRGGAFGYEAPPPGLGRVPHASGRRW